MSTTLPKPSLAAENYIAQLNHFKQGADTQALPAIVTEEDIYYDHKPHFDAFKHDVRQACARLMEKGSKYNRVSVLITYWARTVTDRPHIEEHAKALRTVFDDGFGYETHEIVFENDAVSYRELQRYFLKVGDSISNEFENNLFILYYGGHGMIDGNDNGMWQSREGDSPKTVDWQSAQQLLKGMDFDVLFLFDCCYALSMIDTRVTSTTWKKACELIGASGRRKKAGGTKDASFTAAFTELLREELQKYGETNPMRLGTIISDQKWIKTEKRTLKTSPRYECFSYGCPKISLVPLKKEVTSDDSSSTGSSNTLLDTVDCSDAMILFGISTSILPDAKEFIEWLSGRPRGVSGIKVAVYSRKLLQAIGLWESNSGLAILSVPIWFWFALPKSPAYQYIAITRSDNLLVELPHLDPVPQPVDLPQSSTAAKLGPAALWKPSALKIPTKADDRSRFGDEDKIEPFQPTHSQPPRTQVPWARRTPRAPLFASPSSPPLQPSKADQTITRISASIPGNYIRSQMAKQLPDKRVKPGRLLSSLDATSITLTVR